MEFSSEHYFGLDGVGTRIWQLLKEGQPLGEVMSLMLDEYDVSEERLQSDMFVLLERLYSVGLIELDDPETPI